MPKIKVGHPSVFTTAQNKALRAALTSWIGDRDVSQKEVGDLLGISQQVAGRLLRRKAGFSYASATRLAQKLGFTGVDALFANHVAVPEDAQLHARAS